MRSPGLLNFLYLRWFLRRLGLPALRAAQGFHGFFGWIARVRRSRRAFEDTISSGDASLVFLGRRTEKDPFATLVRMQRDLFQPIFSSRSCSSGAAAREAEAVLLGRALRLARGAERVRGRDRIPAELPPRGLRRGPALDLQARLRERPDEPDATAARKIRGVLYQHLRASSAPPWAAAQGASPRAREGDARSHAPRRDLGRRRDSRPAAALSAEAERDLKEIASRFDPAFVGLMRGLLAWMFGRLYRSVEVDEEGLARVKRAAAAAPIVLCPSHKSHIDYLVLSFLLYEHGMTPPHVAAGINLSFWPFGAIARRGARSSSGAR
jgi:glycerol-3-phosphate O-acyltransferase